MEIKKIVWASDGSEESDHALNYAVFIAQKFNAMILGLYVSTINIVSTSIIVAPVYYEFNVKAEKDQKEKFSKLNSDLLQNGLHFEGKVIKGEASEEIVRYAESQEANLIVMGTRGHGLLDSMMFGSTTLKALRNSRIPVLACKKEKKSAKVKIKNILVPLEISEGQDSTLIYALNIAKILDANITVLNVVISGEYGYVFPKSILNESMAYAHKKLEKILMSAKSKGNFSDKDLKKIKITINTAYGPNYGISISDYANKKNIDLIVIHTHSKRGIEKLMLGSVTESVIRKAHCSVLALKP